MAGKAAKKTTTRAANLPTATLADAAGFSWGDTQPCVATYKVLEGDKFLDQFEDAEVPFAQAGTLAIGRLRFFPHATTNPSIIGLLSIEMARKFLTLLTKTFSIVKHDPGETSADIIRTIAAIFANKDKTLTDLAKVVND